MTKPTNCITVAEARQLQDNWVTTRAVEIDSAQGFVDAREFLFSVAELQEFLDYIKNSSAGPEQPGVRIYFAAYNNDASNKATVFLAPTLGIIVGSPNNYALEPLNRSIAGWPPKNY